jgi:Flp pilus assembly protein TadB
MYDSGFLGEDVSLFGHNVGAEMHSMQETSGGERHRHVLGTQKSGKEKVHTRTHKHNAKQRERKKEKKPRKNGGRGDTVRQRVLLCAGCAVAFVFSLATHVQAGVIDWLSVKLWGFWTMTLTETACERTIWFART